jgi:hypothetical protein
MVKKLDVIIKWAEEMEKIAVEHQNYTEAMTYERVRKHIKDIIQSGEKRV